jgi:predicted PhzF superfamily epimerase YddE/YHI9
LIQRIFIPIVPPTVLRISKNLLTSSETSASHPYYPSLATLMAKKDWTTIWAETPVLFHARDPFPPVGVREDPATAAAAAASWGGLHIARDAIRESFSVDTTPCAALCACGQ